ncbi:MAG: F0F1 ATP synthase subunit delta [Marmoricola sp.]
MMRGASAVALADLTENLGKTRTLADAATIGEQLFGVARVLRAEVALRRAATDTSVEGEAKAALVQTIFGSALEDGTLKIVSEAVQQRWTISRDLPDALEHLGVVSLVRSAGAAGDRVSDELFGVRQLVDANPELRAALADPARSAEDRNGLLGGLLEGRTLPAIALLVAQAVSGDQGTVDTALKGYQQVAADARDETVATVHTARELSADDQQRLSAALGKQYDTNVHLHVVVDPDLVGGLRVEIRDDVIDGTVVSRLDDARRRLAG